MSHELTRNYTPTVNEPLEIMQDVSLYKKGTRYHIRFINEEYMLQFDQKVLRKFVDVVMSQIIQFFDKYPDYTEKYFRVYKAYLQNQDKHSEKLLKSIVAIMYEGFELLDEFLQSHENILELKLPTDKNYKQLIEIDKIKDLVYYSWKLKLYSFYKYLINVKINNSVDKLIMNKIIDKHLDSNGLADILLNIVKGKVITTIQSRAEMWRYLEYSIRKSPELYISQLYNYTILYILLFMKNAYNPIGYIGNFIDRQILYIFSDVYVTEVVYHNIDDYHIKFKGLDVQSVANYTSSIFLETINNFYGQDLVNKFLANYKVNTSVVNLLVYPIINKLLFRRESNVKLHYNYNVGIYTMYAAIMYSSSLFNFKYIPQILLSNTLESQKVNFRKQVRETIMINCLYEIPLRNIDILQDTQVFNNVINTMNNIYRNILTNKMYEFNIFDFVNEFKQLLNILSNEEALNQIRDSLEFNNYMFKKLSPLEQIGQKVVTDEETINAS